MTQPTRFADVMLTSLGLADLLGPAIAREPFARADLERVLATGNPLAAASLADTSRRSASGVDVTHPWTLRVRAPGVIHGIEDATRVAHDVGSLGSADGTAGIVATEMEMLGALPADTPLAAAIEMVRSLVAARPDLPLRAFTAGEIDALATLERRPRREILVALRDAGVATLSWRPGCGQTAADVEVHRAAHQAGVRTVATVGTSRGAVDTAFLDRLDAWVHLAREAHGFLAATALPDRTDGASPLEGTSGTEDWTACSLVRLAFGSLVPRVTTDWHAVGHKLGSTMLACGADDVVGAQAAARWAPATDDGPRPLNPDRVRKWIIESRRSPVRRDALFRSMEPA